MKIQVQLFATLSSYLPETSGDHTTTLDVPDGSTIRDVVDRLEIPAEIPTVTLVNGRDASREEVLKEGDTLTMFPPLAGGCAGRARRAPGSTRGRDWMENLLTLTE